MSTTDYCTYLFHQTFALLHYFFFPSLLFFFFFNDTATTEIYTLSLHDALPISDSRDRRSHHRRPAAAARDLRALHQRDRKSTRLNSSHVSISYAVFCLKKKKKKISSRHSPR